MNKIHLAAAQWRKSSHSGGESGMCVEVAQGLGVIGIRDSKNPGGGRLAVDRDAFQGLVRQAKAGDLDL
ncbi:DUF397 domain-containing protein [Thermomonospora umbrina]|uniref:Uncharacterized protein DUF397 n=1 Tax=Thermomonospora umbrina TaxID=111806 RepID=A0A3D9SS31_9ACTN|nr:DUF397 domain-containing protein [Thermomonospora umbrina]REE96773.1 uncharacterized protein DUF397 [Thermomonospora umbrina]